MRKLFFIATLVFFLFLCNSAKSGAVDESYPENPAVESSGKSMRRQMQRLMKTYKSQPDVDVISIGPFLVSLARSTAKFEVKDSPDEMEMLSMLDGVERLAVMVYEDAPYEIKSKIAAKIDSILTPETVLLEVNDDGEKVRIHSDFSEDSDTLSVVVISVDNETLVCFFGKMSLSQLQKLISNVNV